MTKKHWLIIGISLALLGMLATKLVNDWQIRQFLAEKRQPKIKEAVVDDRPECLKTETLRIQLGKRVFEFPREYLNAIYYDNMTTKDPDRFCQHKNDPVLKAKNVILSIYPKKCEVSDCQNRISMEIRPSDRTSKVSQQKIVQELIQECKEKEYFHTCKHWVYWNGIGFTFHYYLQTYPVEEMAATLQSIKDTLNQYEITSEQQEQ